MENVKRSETKETLLLTKNTFNILINKVISHFKKEHTIINTYKDSQLYGFGNYDSDKPNLKNDLELILRGYVNGKYLYNKHREVSSGKPIIKISREYKYVFFNYIGYKDVFEFIEQEIKEEKETQKQLELLRTKTTNKNFFYTIYYYGEDQKMTKGEVVIYDNWKTFELVFIYINQTGNASYFNLFGNIKQQNNFIHFDTKLYNEKGIEEGANMIFYVGLSSFGERPYLIGTYSSFDKYNHSIAGKIMLKKMKNKADMEREANSTHFEPSICQELIKYRFIINSNIPQNQLKLSNKSPYSSIFGKIPNKYKACFIFDEKEYNLNFNIEKYHYNIISMDNGIFIEDDRLSLENKAQILELHFNIVGMFKIQKASMYFKIYDFLESNGTAEGNYNGIDINNNLVSGNVLLKIMNSK
jgi:hypothetical protein